MAVSDSREVVIEATPEEILDVIADVETAPDWSSQHQGAEILDTDEKGRPGRVKLKLKTMCIADEQVVQYESAQDSGREVHADPRRRQDQGEVRDHRRPVGADPRVRAQAGDEGRARVGHRRPAKACAEGEEGRQVVWR